MDENMRMENSDMEEILNKLEVLFSENPKYNMETLKKYLGRTSDLTVEVNRIKEAVIAENPGISHEEIIEKTSARVAEMVQSREAGDIEQEGQQQDTESR